MTSTPAFRLFPLLVLLAGCGTEAIASSHGTSPPKVFGVLLDPPSISLVLCDSFQFEAKVSQINESDRSLVWSTTDSDVTIVSPTNTAFAVGTGDATITATADADTAQHDTAHVTVLPPAGVPAVAFSSLTSSTTGGTVDTTNVSGSIHIVAVLSLAVATNHCLPPPQPASVELALVGGGRDTVLATQSIDLTTRGAVFIWNTVDRTPAGTPAFPNGSYVLALRIVLQGGGPGGTLVTYAPLAIRVNNS